MDPVEVRVFQEGINRKNRKGKPYYNDARKKQITKPELRDIEKIRGMQEGNVLARLRAQRAMAEQAALPRNEGGRVVAGTPVPAALQTQIGQWGRPNIVPGQKRPAQELLPRPVRPVERRINENPEVVQMGAPAPGTEVEGASTPRRSSGYNQFQKQMDLRRAKNRQRRDIGIVSGGVLASILGLDAITRKEEEEAV